MDRNWCSYLKSSKEFARMDKMKGQAIEKQKTILERNLYQGMSILLKQIKDDMHQCYLICNDEKENNKNCIDDCKMLYKKDRKYIKTIFVQRFLSIYFKCAEKCELKDAVDEGCYVKCTNIKIKTLPKFFDSVKKTLAEKKNP